MDNFSGLTIDELETITEFDKPIENNGKIYERLYETKWSLNGKYQNKDYYYKVDGKLFRLPVEYVGSYWDGETTYNTPKEVNYNDMYIAILRELSITDLKKVVEVCLETESLKSLFENFN